MAFMLIVLQVTKKLAMKTIKENISRQKLLRPTTGKVREALFNILRGSIEDSRFLDFYAGTGAVGIEALRQGASDVVFVEADRGHAKDINRLIEKSGLSENAYIVTRKALSFIGWAELNNMTFDIIFLDPPYHTDEILQVLTTLGKSRLLRQDGLVIAEHFKKKQLPESFDSLQKTKDYNYGDTVLTFYKVV